MNLDYWLTQAVTHLAQAGIGTARLDALVLLEDVVGRDRAWLLAHPEEELSKGQVDKLEKLLRRRVAHEPLAYVRGKTEFYGREFIITPAVLEPRPESETMIDLLKELCLFTPTATPSRYSKPSLRHPKLDLGPSRIKSAGGTHNVLGPGFRRDDAGGSLAPTIRVADVGAGSGALGITAALELPGVSIDLLEIDAAALEVAKMNVDKYTISVSVIQSDLLNLQGRTLQDYDVLLCNLPYVPDSHTINQAAMHEPRIAIFGGPDGLDLYRRLFEQVAKQQKQPLFILTESLPPQHEALQAIAEAASYKLLKSDDFIQVFQLTIN